MSDATRAVALSEANKTLGGQADGKAVLALALQYDNFLNDTATPSKQVTSAAAADPKPPKDVKKVTGSKKPLKTEDELVASAIEAQQAEDAAADEAEEAADEAEVSDELPPNEEGVKAAIARALKANKRKETIALLKKYGAASATGIKAKVAAKFIAEALALAAEGDEDLTA